MKNFIVIYHAPAEAMAMMDNATPEQKEEGMKPWMEWAAKCGDRLVDFGTPLIGGTRINPGGSTAVSGKDVTGYSVIQAEDLDAAVDLMKDHPHLTWTGGCDIEIHESVPL